MNTMRRSAVIVINIACPSNIASVTDARKVVDAIYTATVITRRRTAVIVINVACTSNIASVTDTRELVDTIATMTMNTRKGAAVIVINVACPSNIARVTNAREVVDVIDTASSVARVTLALVNVRLTLVSSEARKTITVIRARSPGVWNTTSIFTLTFSQNIAILSIGSQSWWTRAAANRLVVFVTSYVRIAGLISAARDDFITVGTIEANSTGTRVAVYQIHASPMNTRRGTTVVVVNVACPSNKARVTRAREGVISINTATVNARG